MLKKINNSLKNADDSYSGKVIAGLVSLLIVLVQQIFAMFGVKFNGDWSAIVAVVNTVLTILGIFGAVSGDGVVEMEAETPVKAYKSFAPVADAPASGTD